MAFGDLITKADTGFYFGKQSGKGSSATALRGFKTITDGVLTPQRDAIEGVVGMGSGLYVGQDIPLSFVGDFQITLRVTLNTALSLLATFASGATTGDGTTTVRETTYTPYQRGRLIPWFTLALVYGESSVGSGILPVVMRDCKVTKFNLKIVAKDAAVITLGFNGLNMGPGLGTETFTYDSAEHYPVPTIASNVLTFPSWFPSQYSVMSLEYDWTAKAEAKNPRLASPESAGIIHSQAGWTIKASIYFDDPTIFQQIYYGTTSPTAGTSALVAAFKTGAHSFEITSSENIGVSSPLNVPYRLRGSFTDVQWTEAPIENNSDPNMIALMGKVTSPNWSFAVRNNELAAAMISA